MIMDDITISGWISQLKERELDSGGFPLKLNGDFHPEATCWAILALAGDPVNHDVIMRARSRLATVQLPDGRVCLSRNHPEAFWPTYLAVLAWHQSLEHQKNQSQAVDFLLRTSGKHWPKKPDLPVAHDTNLPGWPWIAGTYSWVEPTGLAMLALRITGQGNQERVREGVRLLLDRQLPHGGWNYGNTKVFGHELRPMPLSTGIALNALKSETPAATIQVSLAYLQNRVLTLRTPLSLGWGLLGLGAWQTRPPQARQLISECFKRQARYGGYDTACHALLIVAFKLTGGLEDIFSISQKS